MICDIIKDLMPLYVADECSAASKEAVDAHVWSCDACRASLDAMQAPVALTPAEVDEKDTPKVEAMNFKKGFKKIRRRWVTSIVCVILAIPFAFLGVNEVRGEGYAFSNLHAVYQTDAFMRKIVAKDYEGAVEMLDVWPMYYFCVDAEMLRDTIYDQYREVQIGGETYFSRLPSDTSRLVYTLEDNDPAEFWAQIIIDNAAEEDMSNPIPTEFMEEASGIVFETIGKEISIVTQDSEMTFDDYAYIEEIASDGRSYFFPTKINLKADYEEWLAANYLPEQIFFERMDTMFFELKGIPYHSQTYEKLGIDEYCRLFKEQYVVTLEKFAEQGIFVTSYGIDPRGKGYGFMSKEDGTDSPTFCWGIEISIQSPYSNTIGAESYLSVIYHSGAITASGYGVLTEGDAGETGQQIDLVKALSGNSFVL